MALTSVEEALSQVISAAPLLEVEWVPVGEAAGRVLREDVIAKRSQPAADMSAMDGYAVCGEDAERPTVSLRVIAESAAGRPFTGAVGSGEAVRIFTGGVMPKGADTVIIQEDTTRDGDIITTTKATPRGHNVRLMGCDFRLDAPGLKAGCRLSGRDIMLAAAMNHATLPVARRPRVALMQTGDELVLPGQGSGAESEVVVSNVYGIATLARQLGAEVVDLGIIPDQMEATRAAVAHGLDGTFDLLVTTGGASVGDHDLVAPALRAEGVDLHIHKIALRPGKPLMFGTHGKVLCLGLPGNPVSSHVCSVVFMAPVLRAMQGEAASPMQTVSARLATAVPANGPRRDFMRATTSHHEDGTVLVTPANLQDSSMLAVLARADCLLVRPPHAPAAAAGDICEIMPFED